MWQLHQVQSVFLNVFVKKISRSRLFKWAWYERRRAVALLELSLLWHRVDCACARANAHAWLRARAQSDTGVGRILMFGPLKIHPDFLKTWDRHLHFHGTFFVVWKSGQFRNSANTSVAWSRRLHWIEWGEHSAWEGKKLCKANVWWHLFPLYGQCRSQQDAVWCPIG